VRFLVLGLLFVASPALEDWEFTNWGMTPDEVVAASAGSAHRVESRAIGSIALEAVGTYDMAGVTFTAQYHFSQDHQGLHSVVLAARDVSQCPDLTRALAQKYGPPEVRPSAGGGSFSIWRDRRGNSLISLTDDHVPGRHSVCTLIYRRP
jgi:hypothetical protein